MRKVLLALLFGLALGYFYGFADAKRYPRNIVSRAVERVGGKAKGYTNDMDKKIEMVEKR